MTRLSLPVLPCVVAVLLLGAIATDLMLPTPPRCADGVTVSAGATRQVHDTSHPGSKVCIRRWPSTDQRFREP